MSAAAAFARADAAGVRFRLLPGGRVWMEAAAEPAPEIVADLRRWREDVAHLVVLRSHIAVRQPAPPPRDWRTLPHGRERGDAFAVARQTPGACPCCAGR